jgi:hypothetical protein
MRNLADGARLIAMDFLDPAGNPMQLFHIVTPASHGLLLSAASTSFAFCAIGPTAVK